MNSISELSGDTHLRSALSVLKSASLSNDPKARLLSCITHLESAHHFYLNIYDNNIHLGDINPVKVIIYSLNFPLAMFAVDKDLWVCSLMAMAYAALDDPGMVGYCLHNCYRASTIVRIVEHIHLKSKNIIVTMVYMFVMLPFLLIGALFRYPQAISHGRKFNKPMGQPLWLSTSDIKQLEDALSTSMECSLHIHVLNVDKPTP